MDTSSWKWFNYTDLFSISGSKTTPIEELETYGKGEYPYVTTQAVNNGVESFYNFCTEKGGVLTVDSAVLGFCSYQEKDFSASDHVEVLTPKFEMNKYIALFLTTIMNKEQYRYSYGRKCSQIKLRRSCIKLPVTQEGAPDWQYMESFIKDRILPQLPKKAQKVWLQKYDTKPQKQEAMKLNTDEWREFRISDLFNVLLTKGDIMADEVDAGDVPLISSGEKNNGVVKYISKKGDGKAEMFPANTITLDMFCHANYQGVPYYAVGHGRVNILLPKFELNKFIGLFICTLINREVYRFSYGRAVYSSVAEKMIIRIPVSPSGTPDWQFMEDYIKSLPYSKNLEPSDPKEVVDELVEMKKEMIKMRQALEAQQKSAQIIHIDTYNDNSTNYSLEK